MSDDFPKGLKYNKDNSWVKIEGGTATLGVIGPAARMVKEFVFVRLPEKGKPLKKGDVYVSLESLKWSGHMTTPLTGTILEVNERLYDNPSSINKDPYGSWIMKVKLTNPAEAKELLDASAASAWWKKHGGK